MISLRSENTCQNDSGISGTIPTELAGLPNLESLLLPGNRLTGSLPSEILSAPSLQDLYLGRNELTGSLDHAMHPNLQRLLMGGNQLTGECERIYLHACSLTYVA